MKRLLRSLCFLLLTANAWSQQIVQFIIPGSAPSTTVRLSVPNRQVFPYVWPAETYFTNLTSGANNVILNPGLWSAAFTANGSNYTFLVTTNTGEVITNGAYNCVASNAFVEEIASTNTFIYLLPLASVPVGYTMSIINAGTATLIATNATGSPLLNGYNSFTNSTPWSVLRLISDGAQWLNY